MLPGGRVSVRLSQPDDWRGVFWVSAWGRALGLALASAQGNMLVAIEFLYT